MSSTTQFSNTAGKPHCDVVIGFDFGTSCSKVVVRTPYDGNLALAAEFGNACHASSKYLLPSVLWLSGDVASFIRCPDAVILRDVKFHLMVDGRVPAVNGDDASSDAQVVAVAFLASALRDVRHWYMQRQHRLLSNRRLRWEFNLGLPSADYAEEPVRSIYQKVAEAAWALSVRPNANITLTLAQYVLSHPDEYTFDDDDEADIHTIPEVVAEVIGYARSDARDEGLHLLVDVGASTLDVCGFVLRLRASSQRRRR